MPRAVPKKTTPVWLAHTPALSDSARAELAALLKLDPRKRTDKKRLARAYSRVEYWLGFYPGGVKNLDQAPGPADYKVALRPMIKRATDLLNRLIQTQWMDSR